MVSGKASESNGSWKRVSPVRMRRLRKSEALRRMRRETVLRPDMLIYPMFAVHGSGVRRPVTSMPGVEQCSPDEIARKARSVRDVGVPAVLLFGIPATKDSKGSENWAEDGVVQQAVRAIRDAAPEMAIVTDVCLCEYTDHGHCGLLDAEGNVLNDETLEIIRRVSVSHAEAGADIVAPSGMLDHAVRAIRDALDSEGFADVAILSYAVKYASAFYGPFREAAEGAPKFGDRRTHQMDPANVREALREARLDVEEGADMLMVKPALAYLDVIRAVRQAFGELPLAAYNVSGEYSMLKAAAERGWVDEQAAAVEMLTSIARAGADIIITYYAEEVARWLVSN